MASPEFGPRRVCLPLLPYEHQLIHLLGWSEDEYRVFRAEVERKQGVRPAGYEHIPDVRGDALTVAIISLAFGVISTAVSYLITPKPKAPPAQQQRKESGGSLTLGDRTGPTRFNSTFGFDSSAGLASWGEPIPIAFGKYTGNSGGLLITPKLVWSRLFSYGNYQMVKALYSCGEWGMAKPSLEGVYIGDVPLDPAYNHLYAIYFRKEEGNNRITGDDLLYGTRGTPDSGDPETYPDVFSCPTPDAENDDAFCYTHTPSNSTQFGIYNAIANGTGLRAMWRIISFPREGLNGEAQARIRYERQKICGTTDTSMEGVGREYVRGVGIIEVDGQTVNERTEVQIDVGSTLKVLIAGGKIPDLYEKETFGVTTDDLNNTLENERANADDLMQIGDTFQIGRTSWRVIERSENYWKLGTDQLITLKCIDHFGAPFVTAIPRRLVDDFTQLNAGQDFTTSNHIGISSTPIAQQAMGIVKPVRESDAIEIGIRSQVWNQANNMMNWVEVPEPAQLTKWDEYNMQVQGGVMATYLQRTSAFTVKVRPSGISEDGTEYEWKGLGEQFCIRGRQPTDQFNFLRIYLPQRGKYEFRFEPLPGCEIVKAFDADELFWELDGTSTNLLAQDYATPYGTFRVFSAGRLTAQEELIGNPETGYIDQEFDYVVQGDSPTVVAADHYETRPYFDPHGKAHGWRNELFGFASQHQGQTKSVEITAFSATSNQRSCRIRVTSSCIYSPGIVTPDGYSPQLATAWLWIAPTFEVLTATNTSGEPWSVGEELVYELPITRDPATNNNKWLHRAYTEGARYVSVVLTVQQIGTLTYLPVGGDQTRIFIPASQCADVTQYPGSWSKSNDSNPEHEISYVNEIQINEPIVPSYYNMTMAGLSLKASKNFSSLAQLRFWVHSGIPVYRFLDGTTGRSNLFTDFVYWLLTNKDAGAGDKVSDALIDKDSFARTAKFLNANKIFFDGVLEEPVNIRSWTTQNAKLLLCNFTIIDGQFGFEPALPVDAAGAFSTEAVPIAAIFSEGNIIADSFALDYLELEERADFKAVMTYRYGAAHQLPQSTTVTVRYAGEDTGKDPIETYDLSSFCTQRDQSILTAKYLLALRRHITHTVKFQTTPDGLGLKPGDFIRVVTEANPYTSAGLGAVLADSGRVVAVSDLPTGTYTVAYYRPGMEQLEETDISITEGRVDDPAMWGSVFTIRAAVTSANVYQVQQMTLTEEGLVDVVALDFPCDDNLSSLIVKDILNDDVWAVTE